MGAGEDSYTGPHRTFHIEQVLGRGSFGTVYRARMQSPEGFTKRVALKLLNPEAERQRELAQRLRDEARMLGLVSHRAIIKVDSLIRLDDSTAVVMEYVEGVDLRTVHIQTSVPPRAAVEIVGEVAGALDAAWSTRDLDDKPLHLLHRDIKPANIRLTTRGEVKLLDFGVARADFEAREARTQAILFGSLNYMAPERFDMIDGPAGDVYALGVVLYELLMGEELGRSFTRRPLHERHVREAMARLAARECGHIPALATLLDDLLSHSPEDRPTARQLERRCGRISARIDAVSLRDWAEEAVPRLRGAPEAPDERVGAALVESMPSMASWSLEHEVRGARSRVRVSEAVVPEGVTEPDAPPAGTLEEPSTPPVPSTEVDHDEVSAPESAQDAPDTDVPEAHAEGSEQTSWVKLPVPPTSPRDAAWIAPGGSGARGGADRDGETEDATPTAPGIPLDDAAGTRGAVWWRGTVALLVVPVAIGMLWSLHDVADEAPGAAPPPAQVDEPPEDVAAGPRGDEEPRLDQSPSLREHPEGPEHGVAHSAHGQGASPIPSDVMPGPRPLPVEQALEDNPPSSTSEEARPADPAPTEGRRPTEEQAPPTREPGPPSPPLARWSLGGGGALQAFLLDSAGARHDQGGVPPGTYRVMAAFADAEPPILAATLELEAGDLVVVQCDAGQMRCVRR